MSETQLPPDRPAASTNGPSKRPYHAPELRELGSVTDMTQTSNTSSSLDGPSYSYGS